MPRSYTRIMMMMKKYKIYLAGPEVFLPNAEEIGRMKVALCEKYGFIGLFPLDNEVPVGVLGGYDLGLAISSENETRESDCDIVVANITPFRGISADPGTVYELGLGKGFGLKTYAYTNVSTNFNTRTMNSTYGGVNCKDVNGMQVEDFGMVDNLMIVGGIMNGGGSIVIGEGIYESDIFTNLDAFEEVLISIKEDLFGI